MENKNEYLYFEAAGAGKIQISNDCFRHTGRSFGFSIGVSWGQFGYAGGVLDREDAKKLADFILSEYEKVTVEKKEEEKNSLIERDKMLKEFLGR